MVPEFSHHIYSSSVKQIHAILTNAVVDLSRIARLDIFHVLNVIAKMAQASKNAESWIFVIYEHSVSPTKSQAISKEVPKLRYFTHILCIQHGVLHGDYASKTNYSNIFRVGNVISYNHPIVHFV